MAEATNLKSFLFFESTHKEVLAGFVIGLTIMGLLFLFFILAHQNQ